MKSFADGCRNGTSFKGMLFVGSFILLYQYLRRTSSFSHHFQLAELLNFKTYYSIDYLTNIAGCT